MVIWSTTLSLLSIYFSLPLRCIYNVRPLGGQLASSTNEQSTTTAGSTNLLIQKEGKFIILLFKYLRHNKRKEKCSGQDERVQSDLSADSKRREC